MNDAEKDRIVALAVGLIAARGDASVKAVSDALEDARHMLFPAPSNAKYKDWQVRNGMTPSTPEEDAERRRKHKRHAEHMASKAAR